MRNLTESESKQLFEKLHKFIKNHLPELVKEYVFRLQRNKIYMVPNHVDKHCSTVPRKSLVHCGIYIAKITHNQHIHLTIGCLHVLTKYARKVTVKGMGVMYGQSVLRRSILKMSDDIQVGDGVVICSEGVDAGFGIIVSLSTDPTKTVVINQADLGEYLRDQEHI
eukprot:NODE_358_length_8800_cov_0.946673.p8 type:complete len:166 gc:universal NODE_358_length_8800_cov_0.946673:2189-1692(-)